VALLIRNSVFLMENSLSQMEIPLKKTGKAEKRTNSSGDQHKKPKKERFFSTFYSSDNKKFQRNSVFLTEILKGKSL